MARWLSSVVWCALQCRLGKRAGGGPRGLDEVWVMMEHRSMKWKRTRVVVLNVCYYISLCIQESNDKY